MADKKTSDETAASALDGTELVRIVQSGSSVQTTTQDIADLGDGGNSGMVLLANGTITNQPYFDLSLPDPGLYASLKCQIVRLVFSTNNGNGGLAAVFSDDNGSTFYNGIASYSVGQSIGQLQNVMLVSFNDWSSDGSLTEMNIVQGAASHNAYIQSFITYRYNGGESACENAASWLIETTGIMNKIRFAPYGDAGVMNPPAGLILIATATYFLWGLPTP